MDYSSALDFCTGGSSSSDDRSFWRKILGYFIHAYIKKIES